MANTEVQRQPDTPFELTILYMEDARSWCEYLFDIFQPYEVYQNSEEITTFPNHETTLNNIRDSRVVIVIVSPIFLDNIDQRLEDYTHQVVALLCGVAQDDLHALDDSIPSWANWKIVEALSGQRNITQVTLKLLDGMDSDTEDTTDYLTMQGVTGGMEPDETYLTMEGNVGQKPSFESEDLYLPMKGGSIEEPEDEYTIMHGGGLVEDVYEQMTTNAPEQDTYEIMTSGKGGGPRMPPRGGPRKPPGMRAHDFGSKGGVAYINDPVSSKTQYSEDIYITPSTVRSGTSEPLFIIFAKLQISNRPEDLYKALFKTSGGTVNVVAIYVNSHTLRIMKLPEAITRGLVTVEILHNNNHIATLGLNVNGPMDVMSQLLSTITNPFDFMCEALNISPADTNMLDKVLYEHCKRHLPLGEGADFGRTLLTTQETQYDAQSASEVPTVLHFAAKYGLTQICMMLLDFPGAYQAMMIKNCNGDTPSGLAQKSGFEDLKQYLENYLETVGIGSEGIPHPDEIGVKGHFETSYVHMTGDLHRHQNPQYTNQSGLGGKKSDYDRPFPVAIPASSSPFMRDDTIKSLVSSEKESDIYDYYDNNSTFFQRDGDDDDDDDNGEDYEHVEEQTDDLPPLGLPPKPSGPKDDDTGVMGNVRITTMEELNKTPKSNPGADIPKDQQALIDLQNMVKNQKISVDDAVEKFKDLQRQDQLSIRQTPAMRDSSLKTPKKTGTFGNIFGRKKDEEKPAVRSLLSNLAAVPASGTLGGANKDLQVPQLQPPVSPKPVTNLPAGGPKSPGGPLKSPAGPKSPVPPPTTPKPLKPGSPKVAQKATSKSVGVGVYDKPRGYQMQERYVEDALSPTSPKQGRAGDRFNQPEVGREMHNRPASTLTSGGSSGRTTGTSTTPPMTSSSSSSSYNSMASLDDACTLPMLSRDDTYAMNTGTGSRNSTLSTGSRDSSYGSAAEIDESEADPSGTPPSVVQRRFGEQRDRKNGRTTRKRFSARFENDYIDKPLPPLPIPSWGATTKAPAAALSGAAPSTGRQESLDDVPMYAPPPPPSSGARRTSDPSSPAPQKPKPQPRRRPVAPTQQDDR